MFGCLHHDTLLSAACPKCGSRWCFDDVDERGHHMCTSRPEGTSPSRKGHRRAACGYPAAEVPPDALGAADIELLRQVASVSEPGSQSNPGPQAFTDLISLCRLAANLATHTGIPPDAGDAIHAAHETHVQQRDDPRSRKGTDAAVPFRSYRHTPNQPALVAAWLHTAWPIWSDDNAQERLTELIARALEQPGGATRWSQLRKHWRPPTRLKTAVDEAHLRASYKGHATLDGRSRFVRSRHTHRNPDHVPQLLWPSAVARIVAAVPALAGCQERTVRRFTAMALLRHIDPKATTWGSAAGVLGLPMTYTQASHNTWRRVASAGQTHAFTAALDDLAAQLGTGTPDYAARRAAMSALDPLPGQVWADLTSTTRISFTRGAFRWQDQARAWMWAEITSGDFYLAPSLRLDTLSGQAQRTEAQAYRTYFAKQPLPQLRNALVQRSRHLLADNELAGPLVYDPWEPP
jgi:hypothetical protein